MFIWHCKAAKGCYWGTDWEEPRGRAGHGADQDGAAGAQPRVPPGVPGTCGTALTVAAVHDCLTPNVFSH